MPPGPVKKLLFKINYVLLNFTDPGALINIDGLNDFGIIVNNGQFPQFNHSNFSIFGCLFK